MACPAGNIGCSQSAGKIILLSCRHSRDSPLELQLLCTEFMEGNGEEELAQLFLHSFSLVLRATVQLNVAVIAR